LQKYFLWEGAKRGKTWALVAWDNLCLLKLVGGLGLRDPKILNSILEAKTWRRWLHSGNELWGKIWTHKYGEDLANQYLIKMYGSSDGSLIWNVAWKNRNLI
jgi:hypothetical protein